MIRSRPSIITWYTLLISSIFLAIECWECEPDLDGYICYFNKTCGKNYIGSGYVSNGVDVSRGEFPSFAQILTPQYICSGVIVSDYHILTSEECLRDYNSDKLIDGKLEHHYPKNIHVYVGFTSNIATKRINGGTHYDWPPGGKVLSTYCLHPSYSDESKDKNIAILTLQDKLVFDEFVQPACWPWDMKKIKFEDPETKCYFVGIGAMLDPNTRSFVHQKKVQKMRILHAKCPEDSTIGGEAICFKSFDDWNPGASACFGDLGGPAYCYDRSTEQYYVIGVKISYGSCNDKEFVLAPLPFTYAWLIRNNNCDPTDWSRLLY